MTEEYASVYGLKDRRNQEIFYVGMSTDPHARYGEHLAFRGKARNSAKALRILDMRKEGMLPELVIFEQDIPIERALDREAYWIRHYLNLGMPLTNIAGNHQTEQGKRHPVKVIYRNCIFEREKLAKWAVFFNTLSIVYEYKEKGEEYSPDFWLPEMKCFFDIKDQMPSKDEINIISNFCMSSGYDVHVFWGSFSSLKRLCREHLLISSVDGDTTYDDKNYWVRCKCEHIAFTSAKKCPIDGYEYKNTFSNELYVTGAYNMASAARFRKL